MTSLNPLINTPAPSPAPASPSFAKLTPQQIAQLQEARRLGKKVRRAVNVALFDGWTLAIFACITLLASLVDVAGSLMHMDFKGFDFIGLALGIGMAVVAGVELRGAARLRALDPNSATTLGYNQLVLAAILILYALWNLYAALNGKSSIDAGLAGQSPEVAAMIQPLARTLSVALYSSLLAIAVFVQGGTALYYFTRRKHIEAYLSETPDWILALQRAGVKI